MREERVLSSMKEEEDEIEKAVVHSVTVIREVAGITVDNLLDLDQMVYAYLESRGFSSSASSFREESGILPKVDKTTSCGWSLQDLVREGFQKLQASEKLVAKGDTTGNDVTLEKEPSDELSDPEEKSKAPSRSVVAQSNHPPKGRERRHEVDEYGQLWQKTKPAREIIKKEPQIDSQGPGSYFSVLATVPTESSDLYIPTTEIPCSDVMKYEGHTSMVTTCAWHPKHASILASGSVDTTARIWDVADGSSKVLNGPCGLAGLSNTLSQVEWNADGTLLATASHAAKANVWSIAGDLKHSIDGDQEGPFIFIKWSRGGSYLLTGSSVPGNNGYLWCPQTGTILRTPSFCQDYADWRSDDSFSDRLSLYTADAVRVKSFLGLQEGEELSVAKWNPEGTLLAAGYKNIGKTKIWRMGEDNPIRSLEGHTGSILDIGWSPDSTLLASGSDDQTLKLWNVQHGTLVTSFHHPGAVEALAFGPHGSYLLTASSKTLSVLSVKEGKIIKTFEGKGNIHQASWNSDGTKIAVCSGRGNSLYVIDMNV